jgi:eukaryotic-like serine/threonine-protein kinase
VAGPRPLLKRLQSAVHLSGAGGVPDDLLQDSVRRLALAMWMVGGTYLIYLLLYLFVFEQASYVFARLVGLFVVVLSFMLATGLRRLVRDQRTAERITIAYQLSLCYATALVEYLGMFRHVHQVPLDTISWNCVLILLFPFLLPMSVRKTLAVALAAATTNALGLWTALSFGDVGEISTPVRVSMLVPPYITAIIAVAPASVLRGLGTRLAKARQIGAYELETQLGVGGMGEVWRARHRLLIRPAAIKLIRPEVLGARDAAGAAALRSRFEREAQATAHLESPHTVELYDFGVAPDGTLFYVMELLDGVDLERLVQRDGAQHPARVVHLLLHLLDSLDDAHRNGLIHRDVKPANLMIGRRARRWDYLRVLDFGLVRPTNKPVDLNTPRGVVQGTPAYLPPEAITGKHPVGPHSDLYAVGCVAWWLLTGRLVFDGETAMQVALSHATERPPRIEQVAEQEIPRCLADLVMACLEKAPRDRPASALALAHALHGCKSQVGEWTPEHAERWWRAHVSK